MKNPLCLFSIVMMGVVTPIDAATVVWSSQSYGVHGFIGTELDTGVFNQVGSFVYAENSGGMATTFDGINFAGDGNLFSGDQYGGFHGAPIAADGRYSGDAVIITLGGALMSNLVAGQAYRVQLLLADGRTPGLEGRNVAVDGSNQGVFANGVNSVTWGPGLLITGTFVADGTTQTFTLQCFDAGGGSIGSQLNALTLYAVPEPTTPLFGSLGLLAFLRRRRSSVVC